MSPRVTVVIPTFNRYDYLVQAIESCLAQTERVRIVVVDHGSSDNTPEVATRFGERIQYVRREFDSGPHFAWLDGCLLADTEFVKLLFDDDMLQPKFVEESMRLFSPAVGFVFSAVSLINHEGERSGELFRTMFPQSGVFSTRKDRKKVRLPLISPSAAIFRKEDLVDSLFIHKLPIQNQVYHGVGPDHFVKLLALMRRPSFGFVEEPLADFRSHPGSITIASTTANRNQDLKLAYLDVANIAALFLLIDRLGLVRFLQRVEPVRRLGRRIGTLNARIRRQVVTHGLLPLRWRAQSSLRKE